MRDGNEVETPEYKHRRTVGVEFISTTRTVVPGTRMYNRRHTPVQKPYQKIVDFGIDLYLSWYEYCTVPGTPVKCDEILHVLRCE